MSRDDEPSGWSGADKSPLVVVQPRNSGGGGSASRTLGSLLLIAFMLLSVVLLVLTWTMNGIYSASLADEKTKFPEARCVVEYRVALTAAQDTARIGPPPPLEPRNLERPLNPPVIVNGKPLTVLVAGDPLNAPAPEGRCDFLPPPPPGSDEAHLYGPHPQLEIDRLLAHNATLRKDNQDRVVREDRERTARRPTQSGLPG